MLKTAFISALHYLIVILTVMIGGISIAQPTSSFKIFHKGIPVKVHFTATLYSELGPRDTVGDFEGFQSSSMFETVFENAEQNGDTLVYRKEYPEGFISLTTVFDSLHNIFSLVDYYVSTEPWYFEHIRLKNVHVRDTGNILIGAPSSLELDSVLEIYAIRSVDFTLFSDTTYTVKELIRKFDKNSLVYFEMTKYKPLDVPIAQRSNQSFVAYPNPASSILMVKILDNNQQIIILDLLGREIHIPQIAKTDQYVSLNTSSLIPGIYWLRTGNQTQKIVIQR